MSVISFRGTTIWSSATNGAGWRFAPGARVRESVDKTAPLGDGTWSLPGRLPEVEHSLELQWRAATPAVIEALIAGLAGNISRGALVVPGYRAYPYCRLSGVGSFDSFKSDSATGYIVRTTLTFTEYSGQ